jgi:hypothetical protein
MARIRTVKPELFRHEDLFEAEKEFNLPLRVAFIGLFTCCDREGRFRWRPRILKLDILPYDDVDMSRVLDALCTRGFLVKYEANGELYGCVLSFNKHQVINNRESDSELPPYPKNNHTNKDLLTSESREPDASRSCLSGRGREEEREGKGKDNMPLDAMHGFQEFYARYPKKKSPADAERAWRNKRLANHFEKIMEDLEQRERQDPQWKRSNPFVPYPASYLNSRAFEDEEKVLSRNQKSLGATGGNAGSSLQTRIDSNRAWAERKLAKQGVENAG